MGRRKKTRNRTRVFIIQDKSGSMHSRRSETISGFNEYVDTLREEGEGEISLSLVQFDTDVDEVIVSRPIEDVRPLRNDDYIPGGMTALNDGVGRAIRIAEKSAGSDDKVLFVIMTDGGENSSVEYSKNAILKQIKEKRRDGWEFTFLGAGEESWDAGRDLGIDPSKSIFYGKSGTSHLTALRSFASSSATYASSGDNSFVVDSATKSALESESGYNESGSGTWQNVVKNSTTVKK